jgi:hypothetical protein
MPPFGRWFWLSPRSAFCGSPAACARPPCSMPSAQQLCAAMLALFVFGGVLPRLPLRILNGPKAAPNSSQAASADRPWLDSYFLDQTPTTSTPASPQPRPIRWQDVALYAYFAAACAFLARFAVRLFLVRRLLATSHPAPLGDGNVCESAAIAVLVALGSKILTPDGVA